jgi:hypothetical protein
VDTKAWDASVESGAIAKTTIKSVVSTTDYIAVLVAPAKGAEKPVSKARTA